MRKPYTFLTSNLATIANHDLFETVWISCFNPFLLQILKLKNNKIKTGYLFQRLSWLHTSYDHFTWSDAWHPHFSIVNQYLVDKAIKNKKELYVWTVNNLETYERIKVFPVSGIITDEVRSIKKYLIQ
jgi:glycerophosphoryl diester phosphodiesterase